MIKLTDKTTLFVTKPSRQYFQLHLFIMVHADKLQALNFKVGNKTGFFMYANECYRNCFFRNMNSKDQISERS